MLEREFFIINAQKYLPILEKYSNKGLKELIDEIEIEKELFCISRMEYKGFIGTIEYSEDDDMFFGKIIKHKRPCFI